MSTEKSNRRPLRIPVQVTVLDGARVIFDKVFEEYPITLGRNPRADVPLSAFDFISSQHAAIVSQGNEVVIVDLESANGIYFQGLRTKKAPVTEDSPVAIGSLLVKFRFHSAEASLSKTSPISEAEDYDKTLPPRPESEMPKIEMPKTLPQIAKPSPVEMKKPLPKSQKGFVHKKHQSLFSGDLQILEPHPLAKQLKADTRVLEGVVTWKKSIYDIQQFYPGDKVVVGRGPHVGLSIPTLNRRTDLALFDGQKTQCLIPEGAEVKVRSADAELSFEDLLKSQAITKWNGGGYLLKLGNDQIASYEVSPDIEVHFRYAPAPRQLTRIKMIEPDEQIKRTTTISGIIHGLIMAVALLNSPPDHGPKIPNVPDRFARLLVEPPRVIVEKKPEPPKPPPPEPPKPEVQAKREPPKVKPLRQVRQQKPKPVAVRPQPLKQVPRISTPHPRSAAPIVAKNPAPVQLNTLGALGALTAVNSKAPTSATPVAININQNAGGPSKFTTAGVLGTLKAPGGKLPPGGLASVQTRGVGVGSGTGYGIQGLRGTAGSRGVAGLIVGKPQIESIAPEEGLTQAQVLAVVKKHQGEIQQCYERALFSQPGLAGDIRYEWEIRSAGGVSWVKVKASQMAGADGLNQCVFGVIKRMKFPVAKNGQATVPAINFPFGKN